MKRNNGHRSNTNTRDSTLLQAPSLVSLMDIWSKSKDNLRKSQSFVPTNYSAKKISNKDTNIDNILASIDYYDNNRKSKSNVKDPGNKVLKGLGNLTGKRANHSFINKDKLYEGNMNPITKVIDEIKGRKSHSENRLGVKNNGRNGEKRTNSKTKKKMRNILEHEIKVVDKCGQTCREQDAKKLNIDFFTEKVEKLKTQLVQQEQEKQNQKTEENQDNADNFWEVDDENLIGVDKKNSGNDILAHRFVNHSVVLNSETTKNWNLQKKQNQENFADELLIFQPNKLSINEFIKNSNKEIFKRTNSLKLKNQLRKSSEINQTKKSCKDFIKIDQQTKITENNCSKVSNNQTMTNYNNSRSNTVGNANAKEPYMKNLITETERDTGLMSAVEVQKTRLCKDDLNGQDLENYITEVHQDLKIKQFESVEYPIPDIDIDSPDYQEIALDYTNQNQNYEKFVKSREELFEVKEVVEEFVGDDQNSELLFDKYLSKDNKNIKNQPFLKNQKNLTTKKPNQQNFAIDTNDNHKLFKKKKTGKSGSTKNISKKKKIMKENDLIKNTNLAIDYPTDQPIDSNRNSQTSQKKALYTGNSITISNSTKKKRQW